jgi:hypothetical protein
MQRRAEAGWFPPALLAAGVAFSSIGTGCAGHGIEPAAAYSGTPGSEPSADSTLTISTDPGPVASTLVVTITSTVPGAVIRYVLGGDEMTGPGEAVPYLGPFVLWPQALTENSTTSVWAYATVDGAAMPPTWSYFQMGLPPDPRPVFSPPGGTYATPQDVTLTTTVPAATIRYTLDGSEPDGGSPRYSGPIHVDASTTIRADASLGYDSTPVVEARYSF